MKKVILSIALIFIVLCTVLFIVFFSIGRTNMDFAEHASVIFTYSEKEIDSTIKQEDFETIKKIFGNKKLYKDSPSCGFSEDVSVKFNDSQVFCIARDTCPIIYIKEKDKYFRITEEEKNELYEILETYGFTFPCV